MAFLALLATLLLAFFGFASGSGNSSSGSGSSTATAVTAAAPHIVLTEAKTGTDIEIGRTGDVPVELRLSHRWKWTEPRVDGPVELQRIDFVADPGYDAWLVQPTGKGDAAITSTGSPGARDFTVRIHVG